MGMGNGLPDWPRARSRALPKPCHPGPPRYPFRLLSLSLIFGRRLRRSLDDLAGRFTAGLGEDRQWQPVACGRKAPTSMAAATTLYACRVATGVLCFLQRVVQHHMLHRNSIRRLQCHLRMGCVCLKMLDQAASIKSGAWQRRS